MSHILDPSDKLLSTLVLVMDRSDMEYAGIMRELKTEIIGVGAGLADRRAPDQY